MAIIAVILPSLTARADDGPAGKMFASSTPEFKNLSHSVSLSAATPHFFPLPPRRPALFAVPVHLAEPSPGDDIPVPRNAKPEALTQDQARQILSIFGSNE